MKVTSGSRIFLVILLFTETILDLLGWFAGIAYGPIIDVIATVTEK